MSGSFSMDRPGRVNTPEIVGSDGMVHIKEKKIRVEIEITELIGISQKPIFDLYALISVGRVLEEV